MTVNRLAAGEVGEIGAAAVRELSARAIGVEPIGVYAADKEFDWKPIHDGGWDWIGVPEAALGGGASLRDLAEVAQAWGETLVPLPLLETIWCKRWSGAARDVSGPVTLSVPRHAFPSTEDGDQDRVVEGLAPFGQGSVPIIRAVDSDHDSVDDSSLRLPETFAPTLRLAAVTFTTSMPAVAAQELAVLWAAECVGAAKALVTTSVDYAKNRTQFGQPIGRFQVIKHRLADMYANAELGHTAAVWASHEPGQAGRAARSAIDAGILVAQSAIQVHGGMGFTWEMGLHYYLRSMLVRRELVSALDI